MRAGDSPERSMTNTVIVPILKPAWEVDTWKAAHASGQFRKEWSNTFHGPPGAQETSSLRTKLRVDQQLPVSRTDVYCGAVGERRLDVDDIRSDGATSPLAAVRRMMKAGHKVAFSQEASFVRTERRETPFDSKERRVRSAGLDPEQPGFWSAGISVRQLHEGRP